jgi:hypothetical protein
VWRPAEYVITAVKEKDGYPNTFNTLYLGMAEPGVRRRKSAETRSRDDNPGWLSSDIVILPHPGDDLTGEEISEARVARQFFRPAGRSDIGKNYRD